MARIKQRVYAGARRFGVNRAFRWTYRNQLRVLCYHGVVADDAKYDELRYSTAVTVSDFRDQLSVLQRHFNPVSVSDVISWIRDGNSLPPSPVLVTFDDGFRNNLRYAAPELTRSGVPALVHIATAYIGGDRLLWPQEIVERVLHWPLPAIPTPKGLDADLAPRPEDRHVLAARIRSQCKVLPDRERIRYLNRLRDLPMDRGGWDAELYDFLTWDDVRALDKLGIEIGSHTVTHPILSQLLPDELERELNASRAAIERELAKPCRAIAYPNGTATDINGSVFRAAADAGYEIGFTLMRGSNRVGAEPLALDRMDIAGRASLDAFHARVSGLFSMLERLR